MKIIKLLISYYMNDENYYEISMKFSLKIMKFIFYKKKTKKHLINLITIFILLSLRSLFRKKNHNKFKYDDFIMDKIISLSRHTCFRLKDR